MSTPETVKPTVGGVYEFDTHGLDSVLNARSGQRVTVARVVTEPERGYDAEVLPMYEVTFPDGATSAAWGDELLATTTTTQKEN